MSEHHRPGLRTALSFTLFLLLATSGRALFDAEVARDVWIVFSGLLALLLVAVMSRVG